MSGRREETALGVARARFVEGLSRRTRELKGAIALLTASPDDARAREELRRRLHALYASAQVFRIEPLADGLKGCITHLDSAREAHRGLTDGELDDIARVTASLVELATAATPRGASVVPMAMPETIRVPESAESPEIDLLPRSGRTSTRPYRVPSVDDFVAVKAGRSAGTTSETGETGVPAEPPEPREAAARPATSTRTKDRESVEEMALRQATVPAPAPEGMAEPDDPFDTAVTSAGAVSAAPPPRPVPLARVALQKRESRGDDARGRGLVTEVGAPRRPSSRPLPNPASRPSQGLSTVVSVLVVDEPEAQARIRAALPAERFELLGATDPEDALRLARASAPDVVLVNKTVVDRPEVDFISRLRSDPLTDGVPVLLIFPPSAGIDRIAVRDVGADDAVNEPIDPERLASRIAELCGLEGDGTGLGRLGDLTVAQVAERMADEIRRGLAEAVGEGGDVAVPLGPGSEVLAAAWSAVARVRAHLAELSHGRVRFRDLPRRGAPAVVGLAEGLEDEGEGPEIALVGRRILVADDDPAVLWFFSQLLKEAGAEVIEAEDGFEALHLARQKRPEVVLSDILMPRMDGMALCRELARDPAVGAVPVILLSWKDDFLQRMRELRAGAHGYLRKEEGTTQILRRVREAIRPRAQLERRLRAGGEVRGRIDQLGVVAILRAVAHERPDSRITVRDAWSLFEIDVRGGAVVDVTRTASDGSFARGARALPLLVGVVDGRFKVVESDTAVRPTIEAALDAMLDEVCVQLGAVLDAVSGAGLGQAAQVELDHEVAQALLAASPGGAGEVLEQLEAGASPLSLLVRGGVEPRLLESVLLDLARRGGVRRVLGSNGEDRISEALEARRKGLDGEVRKLARARDASEPPPEIEWLRDAVRASAVPEAPEPAPEPRQRISEADDLLAHMVSAKTAAEAERGVEVPGPLEPAPLASTSLDTSAGPEENRADGAAAEATPEPQTPVLDADEASGGAAAVPSAEPAKRRPAVRAAGWAALLGLLSLVGFFGTRLVGVADRPDAPEAGVGITPGASTATSTAPLSVEPSGDAVADAPAPEVPPHVAEGEPRLYGRALPGIVADGVTVGAGQGLLRVEADAPRAGTQLVVGGRPVGTPPLDLALDEGLHELVFRSGDQTRYRYVFVRAGESRVVPAP